MLLSWGVDLFCFLVFLRMAMKELAGWSEPATFRVSFRVLLASTVAVGLTGLAAVLLTIRDLYLEHFASSAGTFQAILKIGTVLAAVAWITAMTHRSRLAKGKHNSVEAWR